MNRMCVVGVSLVTALMMVCATSASALKLCVPEKEGAAIVTPKHGKCKRHYKLSNLGATGKAGPEGKAGPAGKAGRAGRAGSVGKSGPEGKAGSEGKAGKEGPQGLEGGTGFTSEQRETMKLFLEHMKYVGSGVGGRPTVEFSGVNVQIVNGEGKTESVNGEGNLVIGYDESPGAQTGSHDLVLGNSQQFTNYGGILAGSANEITAPFASVLGGSANTAASENAIVLGGAQNFADGKFSSVLGGKELTADNEFEVLK